MERLTEKASEGSIQLKKCGNSICMSVCNARSECTECPIDEAFRKLAAYEDLEEQGLLVRLPCKVGDTVYVDSKILPVKNMECYEDIGNKIPSYFQGRVVSSRFSQRNWVKIAVKAKWLYEWIDDETGPESDYIEREKNFTIPLSMIGKYVFLTREEVGGDKKE